MNVYLQDNITGKIYKLTTKENQREFKFKNILYGEYIAYAYPVEELLNGAGTKIGGGYTNAVPCGLTYKCNDHSLIKININSKIHYRGVFINSQSKTRTFFQNNSTPLAVKTRSDTK
jgi:hypothetical protein